MLTEKELSVVNLSPTKKDFNQIWLELMEVASKLSERWDPSSTNESDPGIVLLKVLTGIADKLNYNIDKNILEAFMPSAAQMESVRRLCEILGYRVGYFKSASTEVTITYTGDVNSEDEKLPEGGLPIPRFTTVTTLDKDISYVTTNEYTVNITKELPTIKVPCMEGQIVRCEGDNGYVIDMNYIDDNFRYYLPETQVAENGIFIYNNVTSGVGDKWESVENLNTQVSGKKVFTFGFDSRLYKPYVQFPRDLSQLIEDGLSIVYLRTKGVGGNVSSRRLVNLESPTDSGKKWDTFKNKDKIVVMNAASTTNGKDIESIPQAYKNFKRTVGTFNTLVTCRDYINKIYTMVDELDNNLVSNIMVSDIRDDINNSVTLCSFSNQGIIYNELPVYKEVESGILEPSITNFDLIFYPYKVYRNNNTKEDYVNSFTYSAQNLLEIQDGIKQNKTISHVIKTPESTDIVCIKNYLEVKADITTKSKVNIVEQTAILGNVYKAIYKEFNLREVDFGEKIPYEIIRNCIKNADIRIKDVNMGEPTIKTRFMTADNNEYDLITDINKVTAKGYNVSLDLYNKLLVRNVLAGKVPLFNYDTTFISSYSESSLGDPKYESVYPVDTPILKEKKVVSGLHSSCVFEADAKSKVKPTTLGANEVLKFRIPNLKTVVTYPAYTFYYFHTDNNPLAATPIPAEAISVRDFIDDVANGGKAKKSNWEMFMNGTTESGYSGAKNIVSKSIEKVDKGQGEDSYILHQGIGGALFTRKATGKGTDQYTYTYSEKYNPTEEYYYVRLNSTTFVCWSKFIKLTSPSKSGIFRQLTSDTSKQTGYLVDIDKIEYMSCNSLPTVGASPELVLDFVYVMKEIGVSANVRGIPANCDYMLKKGEYLLINYTPAKSSADENEIVKPVNIKLEGPNAIIRTKGFELKDSNYVHNFSSKHWATTNGFDFTGQFQDPSVVIPGMFSLGPNEQIEVREIVNVRLEEQTMKLYWNIGTNINPGDRYILKEGEYLIYTDATTSITPPIFGMGTEVYAVGVTIPASTNEVTPEAIISDGVGKIPWKTFHFGRSKIGNGEDDKYLTLTEYQYQTLTEGDTINNLDLVPPIGDSNDSNTFIGVTNEWQPCINDTNSQVNFSLGTNGQSGYLPKLDISYVTEKGELVPLYWEVRSFLEFNVGPNQAQQLSNRAKVIIDLLPVDEKGQPNMKAEAEHVILENDVAKQQVITFKTNVDFRTSKSDLDTVIISEDDFGNVTYEAEVKVKIYKDEPVYIYKLNEQSVYDKEVLKTDVDLNAVDKWIDLTLQNPYVEKDKPSYIDFNINIPNEATHYGLMMVYYERVKLDKSSVDNAFVSFTRSQGTEAEPLNIFNNYVNGRLSWWEEFPADEHKNYKLREGINIIELRHSGVLRISSFNKENELLKVSALDIIKITDNDYGLNLDLLGYHVNSNPGDGTLPEVWDSREKRAKALLADLAKLDRDHIFYYNTPKDNSTIIEIERVKEGHLRSNDIVLSSPNIWYDYNNANNKFVISEIDANKMIKGVSIVSSSKL